jgi:hypothetical protein
VHDGHEGIWGHIGGLLGRRTNQHYNKHDGYTSALKVALRAQILLRLFETLLTVITRNPSSILLHYFYYFTAPVSKCSKFETTTINLRVNDWTL